MTKKVYPIAVAFSDIHFHDWKTHNNPVNRLNNAIEGYNIIFDVAENLGVPRLFCGDFFHNEEMLTNDLLFTLRSKLKQFRRTQISPPIYPLIGISGNHDISGKSLPLIHPTSYGGLLEDTIVGYKNVDYRVEYAFGMLVAGIPYIHHNLEFPRVVKKMAKLVKEEEIKLGNRGVLTKVLLIHTDIPGAKTPEGITLNDAENFPEDYSELFKGFDIVLSGHIHKPQRLSPKVIMLGSTNHQNRGNIGTDMGYWIIYSDNSAEFVKMPLAEFKYYKGGEFPDNKHIWVEEDVDIPMDDTDSNDEPKKLSRGKLINNYLKMEKDTSKSRRNLARKFLRNDD